LSLLFAADHINRLNLPALLPRYNIAPSHAIFAVSDFGEGLELASLTWGLIPSWGNDGKGVITAR
jgi:putative SOS response-associated peptidase YedK